MLRPPPLAIPRLPGWVTMARMNVTATRVALLLFGTAALALAVSAQAPVPAGATIVLAQQLVAGQPATLAVLGPDGRLLPGAAVEFSGGKRVITDATGRAAFRAPDAPGIMVTRLSGSNTSATATVTAPPADVPDGVNPAQFPRIVMLGEPFNVRGSGFRGEADANRVYLGEKPAAVLAASPVALVVLPAADSPAGPAQLVIEVGGRSPGPFPVRLIAIDLIAAKDRLAAGEKARLGLRVRGTEQPLELEVRNLTPRVVRLTDGDVQRVRTRGGSDNAAAVEMEGVRAGDFSVSARLVRPASGLPDTETAREKLLAARAQAPAALAPRVDSLIALLGESTQNALRVRNELEKMLAETPQGEFGRLLEAAWRALLTP